MAFCRVPLLGGKALLGLTALARGGSRGGHRTLKRKPPRERARLQHTGKAEQQASHSSAQESTGTERLPIQERLSHKGHHEKKGWIFWNVVFALAPAAVFAVWGMRLRKELEGKDMEMFRVGASAEGAEGETADGNDGEGEAKATGRPGGDALDERIAKLEDVVTRLQAALDAMAEARKEKGVEGGAKAVEEGAEERGKGDGKGTETGK